jgi:metaxin
VPFTTRPSNNHSSPTGALPFLLPPPSSTPSNNFPIPSGDPLLNHALSNAAPPNILDDAVTPRQEAYISLITLKIRPALLHALYINKANTPLLKALYIDPSSRNIIVRSTLLHQVRGAAESEILSTTRRGFVDTDVLYADARTAFSALETALLGAVGSAGAGGFFSGAEEAAIFDAEVFAYTNLILDETLGWVDTHLRDVLSGHSALTRHREKMLCTYFPEAA